MPLRDNAHINRTSFDCGDIEVNKYIAEQAEDCEAEGYATNYLMVDIKDSKLVGFYSLSTSTISPQNVPDNYRSKGIAFPMPAILIGQFGICQDYQNMRLSLKLLGDAYSRIALLYLNGPVTFKAVRVDTQTDLAKAFWLKQGYIPFKKNDKSLFLPVKIILRELGLLDS